MSLLRLALFFLFTICLFFVFDKKTLATGEFTSDYKVTYNIDNSGRANVIQEITLHNNTPNFYADKFELKIGSTKVDNVKAQDAQGPMVTNVSFDENVTTLSVKFNQRVIGLNKTTLWSLSYSSQELATRSGQIWEVSIPKIAANPDIDSYNVQIVAPNEFGPVAFSVPSPKTSSKEGNNQVFTFQKDQLTNSGISMSFGEKQVFEFTLLYFLDNNNLTTRTKNITLPPDNNYQKIVIESITPHPQNVIVDADGNFQAEYKLTPKQNIAIKVTGYVEVFSKPFRNLAPSLSLEDRKKYTLPQRYWETDSALIKDKAKGFNSAREIYDFVANNLSYNQKRLSQEKIERQGALAAFNDPKNAVCMEFTDLFIALARARGIPAREVVGFAYTQNERLRPLSFVTQGDLLHAWPEYWDENLGWVQIDPTWGSTSGGLDYFNKMDFNHITLVQRGLSSTFPLPAGSYKKSSDPNKKDVIISFAQNLPQITKTAQLSLISPEKIIAGVPLKLTSEIQNIGTSSITGGSLILQSQALVGSRVNSQEVGLLPPFSKKEFSFSYQTKSSFSKITDTVFLSFGDTQISKSITIAPIYYLASSMAFVISLAIAAVIIIIGLFLYRRVHKLPKVKRPW